MNIPKFRITVANAGQQGFDSYVETVEHCPGTAVRAVVEVGFFAAVGVYAGGLSLSTLETG